MESTLNEITVTSQEDLDNIPLDYNGYINIEFGTLQNPAIVKHKYTSLANQVRVCECKNGRYIVNVINDAEVSVYGFNIVVSKDTSKISVYNDAFVYAYDKSTIYSYNKSDVNATDNTIIYARDRSTIKAHKNSKVNAYDNSMIITEDNVDIYVDKDSNSKITAYYGCKIHTSTKDYIVDSTSKPFIYTNDKNK